MARLISRQSGNFTAASTWGVVDNGSGQFTVPNVTTLQTSYLNSPAFTVGNGVVVDGIAVYVYRNAVAAGTFTLGFSDNGGSTWAREVTIDVSDIPSSFGSNFATWLFFEFDTTITGDGGSDYVLALKTDTGSQIIAHRDATANNWTRLLRTTTTQTPVAADILYVLGDHTAAATYTENTVTIDETATTAYGAIDIGVHGILAADTTASVNRVLRLSADMTVRAGGLLRLGDETTPVPADSTCVIEFNATSDGQYGLNCAAGGTINARGAAKTRKTFLTDDVAAAGTVLTVADTTGWQVGDELGIASTSRTWSDTEIGTILTVDSATQVTLTAGLGFAHGGGVASSIAIAEVVNLTGNVKVRGVTAGFMAYFFAYWYPTVLMRHVEFRYLGENVANKRGIELSTIQNGGSATIELCVLRDFEDWGFQFIGSYGTAATLTINSNVLYACNTLALANTSPFHIPNLTLGVVSMENNTLMRCLAGSNYGVLDIRHPTPGFYDGNAAVGCTGTGIYFLGTGFAFQAENLVAHSNTAVGLQGGATSQYIRFTNCKSWRNAGAGISTSSFNRLELLSCQIIGNTTNNIVTAVNTGSGHVIIKDTIVRSDGAFTTATGFNQNFSFLAHMHIINSQFGVGGVHTGADIGQNGGGGNIFAWDSIFASTTEVTIISPGVFRSHNHDQTAGYHKTMQVAGNIESETTIRHTASGTAWRLDPNIATSTSLLTGLRFTFPGPYDYDGFPVEVVAGLPVTIRVWVRKSADYGGSQPRLKLIGGQMSGISSDVIDTMSVGAEIWEELEVTATPLTSGTVEWAVDCDGTTGYVYVDDATYIQ
jgi:hypothetical protein